MFRISPRRSLLLVLVAFTFAAFPVVMLANHSWNGYHWARQSNPFNVKMGNNVGSLWQTALTNASADWSQSTVLNTTIVAGGTRPKNCRPTSGQDEICSARYGNTGWLGLAQIWLTTGSHIAQGVVKLNDYYFAPGSQYDTASWRALVTCQEIGHTLGLDHQDTNFDNPNLGTCMDYTSNPDGPPANTSPNKHDYDELVTIYTHLDSFTSVGQTIKMPPAMVDVDYSAPHQWGKLVSGSRESGISTYDLDFGHGNHIVTRVIWVK